MGRKIVFFIILIALFFSISLISRPLARECECSQAGEKSCSGGTLRTCDGCNYKEQQCECGCKDSESCKKKYCSSSCKCGCSSISCNGGTCKKCDDDDNEDPAPTATEKPEATPTEKPKKVTVIPNPTLSPYEERCGDGKCTNGYYCCQNEDGSPVCCRVGSGSGGGGGTSAVLNIRLLDPNMNPLTLPEVSLCKVRCNTAPCESYGCQTNASEAVFSISSRTHWGAGLRLNGFSLPLLGITPYENGIPSETGFGLWGTCRNSKDLSNCLTWNKAPGRNDNRTVHYIINITAVPSPGSETPTPTPIPGAWAKLKNTSFYSNKTIYNPIPDPPIPYDEDDDGSPYFIISGSGSDPGLLSASAVNFGVGISLPETLAPA
ncbi:MAG: hypothetical protein NWE99_07620 [Candidatus Bathyarchaeota archaeon]|nr:hypothetical protein [Candidatus Bathyarchaeota archaeon]